MKIPVKSRMAMLLVTLAASSALLAQTSGSLPGKQQDPASTLDVRQIIVPSVAAAKRSWEARDYHYTYMERDQDRRVDSRGQVTSEDVDITKSCWSTALASSNSWSTMESLHRPSKRKSAARI